MIARIKKVSQKQATAVHHARFLTMLPTIAEQAKHAFRAARPELKEELIAEVIANAFCAFVRLVEREKEDMAYPTPLAGYAIRQVCSGRCVGMKLNVRDVSSRHAQRTKGITVERLDKFNADDGEWKEALVEDRKVGPAETAAARIDVAMWFRSLPRRDRRIAQVLARGESTGATARKFKLSDGRVSQLRRELESNWLQFQGEHSAA